MKGPKCQPCVQLTHYRTITAAGDGIRRLRLSQERGIIRVRLSQRRGLASCYFSSWGVPRPVWYLSDALNPLWMPACASVRSLCLLSTAPCYFSFPPDPPAHSLRLQCLFSSSLGLKRSRLFGDEMQGREREPATPSKGVFEPRFRCKFLQCSSAH